MGIKPIPTKKFLRYLKALGLIKIRTEASHDSFNYPKGQPQLPRPVVVRTKDKDIPIMHIHTNLETLGISHTQFEKDIQNL
jgi:hypothetical protein